MQNWKNTIVPPDTTLQNAIQTMDSSGVQFIIVATDDGILQGVLSDGDVRRAMLKLIGLSTPIKNIMNPRPITAYYTLSKSEILLIMRKHTLHHIPLIDNEKKIIGLAAFDQLVGLWERPNWVVLMLGGLGKRLRPLTDSCPKPMLEIGNKPILEKIVESFIEQGFRKFYFSVNYLADVIRNYFGDGSSFGIEIRYLNETQPLGTGGALSLIPEKPSEDLLVMNGDVLTSMNFDQMLNFHQSHKAYATMAVRKYDFQVPYGVIRLDGMQIINIDEKPQQKFFINAGIYTIHPDCMDYIPKNTFFDMPGLFKRLHQKDKPAIAYFLRERWIDIGRTEEFEHARETWDTTQNRYEVLV